MLLSLFTTGFPGILVYVIMALVMPDEDDLQPLMTTAWISNSVGSPVFSRGAFLLAKTAENVVKMNADTMQIFSRNPRGSSYKTYLPEEIERFQKIRKIMHSVRFSHMHRIR